MVQFKGPVQTHLPLGLSQGLKFHIFFFLTVKIGSLLKMHAALKGVSVKPYQMDACLQDSQTLNKGQALLCDGHATRLWEEREKEPHSGRRALNKGLLSI